MKISIITVCYNSSATIEDTILSVASQQGVDVEHIIIDGQSSDGTVDIIKRHQSITKFISERDSGIYDAMNKGIALATGDVIGTLNADDFYADQYVLKEVAKLLANPAQEACYGDLLYVSQADKDKTVRYWRSRNYVVGLFKSGWMPAHPTFFARKSVYERLGAFNLDYKIAADFELLFRFIELNRISVAYLPKVLVKMRTGGTTNKSMSNVFKQNKEIITILSNHYQDFSAIKFFVKKVFNRLFQFLTRP